MKANKVILMSSPEAAQIKTVTGWVSSQGRFWGENERAARYDGATHKECENNPEHPIIEINSYCNICAHERRVKKYKEMEKVEWDEPTPINNFFGDEYFFSFEDLTDYCVENDTDLRDLHLVLTEPCYIKPFDIVEHAGDDAVEDWDEYDLSSELRSAIDNLNELIKKEPPISYFPTNKAIIFNEAQIKTVLDAIEENNQQDWDDTIEY